MPSHLFLSGGVIYEEIIQRVLKMEEPKILPRSMGKTVSVDPEQTPQDMALVRMPDGTTFNVPADAVGVEGIPTTGYSLASHSASPENMSTIPTFNAGTNEIDYNVPAYERRIAEQLKEQVSESFKMLTPQSKITDFPSTIFYPFKIVTDTYFKGQYQKFSKLKQVIFAYYGECVKRRYRNNHKVNLLLAEMQECRKLYDQGKEVWTTTDYEMCDKELIYAGLAKMTNKEIFSKRIAFNGIYLHPIKHFNYEAKEFIFYHFLKEYCPGLLELAKKHRKDIYLTTDFNFAVGDWIEDHLDEFSVINPRLSNHFTLEPDLKLLIINY